MKNSKKWLATLLTAGMLAAWVSGCSGNPTAQAPEGSKTAPAGEKKVKIVASFYPLWDFASKLAGDRAEVICLVQPGVEPHDWEPTPKDVKQIQEADLILVNGAGMEAWADSVQKSLPNPKAWVDTSAGLDLITLSDEDAHEHEKEDGHDHEHAKEDGHDHEHAKEDGHDHEHSKEEAHDHGQDHVHEHHHHHHGGKDPHVWLSPKRAKQQMHAILEALLRVDPEHRTEYESRFAEYEKAFDSLDQEFAVLRQAPEPAIVTAHEAFAYLCQDYGLKQMGVAGIDADAEPSPAQMAELTRFVHENHVHAIFTEELVSPKVAETLAREAGVETRVLNPLEGLTQEQLAAKEDYFSVMRANLEQLKAVLLP